MGDDGRHGGVLAVVVETTNRVLAEQALAAQRVAIEEANERLTAESAFLEQLFEEAPGFMTLLVGPEHRVRLANAAYRRLVGERALMGKTIRDALPEIEGQGFFEMLDEVFATGRPQKGIGAEVVLQRQPGAPLETRFLDFIYQPVTNADGVSAAVFVEGQDVTERTVAESQVQASEERFRALVTATSDVVYRMSPDWREMRRLEGRGVLTDTNTPSIAWIDEYLFPEDQPEIIAQIDRAIAGKQFFHLEHRVRQADGAVGWTLSRAVPIFGDDGEIVEWFGAASNVTARRRAEEHLRLVINELNHRVKNTLAMIQGIAVQTFRNAEDLEHAQTSFVGRIMAISRANDLLTGERWVGAALSDLIQRALAAHCSPDRYEIRGPAVLLSAKTALSLSMALHELATNALKHGALSQPGGRVLIDWTVSVVAGVERRLHLNWREAGGPAVEPPKRRGFGSRLIERGLAAELEGTVRLDFAPAGLICVLDAPLPAEETE